MLSTPVLFISVRFLLAWNMTKLRIFLIGRPVHEMEQQKFSIIQLNWSIAEFNHYICQCYPQVCLNLVGFELARADRGKKLQKVQVASVMELKMAIGKSRLYVIPLAEVYQVCQAI